MLAFVCATTILAGGFASFSTESKAATAAEIRADLESQGYTRVTPEDFGMTEETVHRQISKNYSCPNNKASYEYLNHTYLDADLYWTTNSSNTNGAICYLGQTALRLYHKTAAFYLYNQEDGAAIKIVEPISNYNMALGKYFNLKLATDFVDKGNGTYDVTIRMWLNNQEISLGSAGTVNLQTKNLKSDNFGVLLTSDRAIKIKTPDTTVGDLTLSSKLEGYSKIMPEHFGVRDEVTHLYTADSEADDLQLYQGYAEMIDAKKSYFEGEVSLTASTGNNGNVIGYLHQYLFRIYRINNSVYVYSNPTGETVCRVNLPDVGIAAGSNDFFNLRIATDMVGNESNPEKTDIKVQIWINGRSIALTTEKVIVENAFAEGENLYTELREDGNIKIRPVAPNVPKVSSKSELEGYTRITPADYGITEELISTTKTEHTRNSKSYNKRYFEADIAFEEKGTTTSNYISYMGDYAMRIYINTHSELVVQCLVDKAGAIFCQQSLSSLEITMGEYFNIKIATTTESGTDSIKITPMIWVNDILVSNGNTTTFTGTNTAHVKAIMQTCENTKIKPANSAVAIHYDDISVYRIVDNYAPMSPEGYIFAGWYSSPECGKANAISKDCKSGEAYAKFVDKHLLRIKSQITANTTADSPSTNIRFITSVDSFDYGKVGFSIMLNGKDYGGANNKVYQKLSAMEGNTTWDFTPKQVYSSSAIRFKAWVIRGVTQDYYDAPFTVTPFWETLDGTMVNGTTVTKTIREAIPQ